MAALTDTENCQEKSLASRVGRSYTTTRIFLLVQRRAIVSRPNYIQHILVRSFDHGTKDRQRSLFCSLTFALLTPHAASYFTLACSRLLTRVAFFLTFPSKRGTAHAESSRKKWFLQAGIRNKRRQKKYLSGYINVLANKTLGLKKACFSTKK